MNFFAFLLFVNNVFGGDFQIDDIPMDAAGIVWDLWNKDDPPASVSENDQPRPLRMPLTGGQSAEGESLIGKLYGKDSGPLTKEPLATEPPVREPHLRQPSSIRDLPPPSGPVKQVVNESKHSSNSNTLENLWKNNRTISKMREELSLSNSHLVKVDGGYGDYMWPQFPPFRWIVHPNGFELVYHPYPFGIDTPAPVADPAVADPEAVVDGTMRNHKVDLSDRAKQLTYDDLGDMVALDFVKAKMMTEMSSSRLREYAYVEDLAPRLNGPLYSVSKVDGILRANMSRPLNLPGEPAYRGNQRQLDDLSDICYTLDNVKNIAIDCEAEGGQYFRKTHTCKLDNQDSSACYISAEQACLVCGSGTDLGCMGYNDSDPDYRCFDMVNFQNISADYQARCRLSTDGTGAIDWVNLPANCVPGNSSMRQMVGLTDWTTDAIASWLFLPNSPMEHRYKSCVSHILPGFVSFQNMITYLAVNIFGERTESNINFDDYNWFGQFLVHYGQQEFESDTCSARCATYEDCAWWMIFLEDLPQITSIPEFRAEMPCVLFSKDLVAHLGHPNLDLPPQNWATECLDPMFKDYITDSSELRYDPLNIRGNACGDVGCVKCSDGANRCASWSPLVFGGPVNCSEEAGYEASMQTFCDMIGPADVITTTMMAEATSGTDETATATAIAATATMSDDGTEFMTDDGTNTAMDTTTTIHIKNNSGEYVWIGMLTGVIVGASALATSAAIMHSKRKHRRRQMDVQPNLHNWD